MFNVHLKGICHPPVRNDAVRLFLCLPPFLFFPHFRASRSGERAVGFGCLSRHSTEPDKKGDGTMETPRPVEGPARMDLSAGEFPKPSFSAEDPRHGGAAFFCYFSWPSRKVDRKYLERKELLLIAAFCTPGKRRKEGARIVACSR